MCASHLPTNTVQTYASHSRAVPPKCNSIRPLAHASELQVAARLGTVSQSGRVAERKEWHKQLKTAATTRQAWQHWCLVIEWWKIRARRRRGRYTRQSQQSHARGSHSSHTINSQASPLRRNLGGREHDVLYQRQCVIRWELRVRATQVRVLHVDVLAGAVGAYWENIYGTPRAHTRDSGDWSRMRQRFSIIRWGGGLEMHATMQPHTAG